MKSILFNRSDGLRTSYFRSFFLLIAIPILLIIFCVYIIIQNMMFQAAVRNLEMAQDNVISTLNGEIKDTMIRLSHFVHTNNNQTIELAELANEGDEKNRYSYMQELTQNFQYMVAPADDIISICFYSKDGSHSYLKSDIVIPIDEIMKEKWYTSALQNKGQVQMGSYSKVAAYSQNVKNQFTLVASISPTNLMDKKQKLDVIALLVSSKLSDLMNNYNKHRNLGIMYLVDERSNILFDISDEKEFIPSFELFKKNGVYVKNVDGIKKLYKMSELDMTGWKVINVVNYSELTKGFNKIAIIIFAITIGLFILFVSFSNFFLKNIITPMNIMAEGFKKVEKGNLDVHVEAAGQAEIYNMMERLNKMVFRLKKSLEINKLEEQKKHEAEIRALQSQINPHFLVNTLNSIRFMAQVSKFDGIKNMAEALIKILTCSFRSNGSFYSIREELDVLKSYVFLMKIRYSDGFEVQYEFDEDCMEYQIPRLILQPIVENSIVHGFSDMEDIGSIQVKAFKNDHVICFEILDNGKGMSKEEIAHVLSGDIEEKEYTSIGVTNVNSRLKLNFGEEFGIVMESEKGNFTKTTILIPQSLKKEGDSDV